MLDDFSRAKAIYDLLPPEDKKSLSLSGDTTFTNSDVVVRLCSDMGFIELFDGGDGYLYRVCKNTMVADHQWCLFCPFSVVGHDDNEICTIQHIIDKLDGMVEERAEELSQKLLEVLKEV